MSATSAPAPAPAPAAVPAVRLSILGGRIEPLDGAVVAPPCPYPAPHTHDAHDPQAPCDGVMAPLDAPHTVVVPASGQLLERLRCPVCRQSGWYERRAAYARMPEVEF